MDEAETERSVLAYLSSNSDDLESFRSLTTIFENIIRSSSSIEDTDDIDTKEALRTVLDQMVGDGLLISQMGSRDYESEYRPTDQGVYVAAFGDDAPLTHSDGTLFSDGTGYRTAPPDSSSNVLESLGDLTFDSSSWTGLSRVRITHRNAKAILRVIEGALANLDANGNAATAQARTLLLAARDLTEAPEPPSDIIWDLIQRAGAVVGFLDIFFRIFSAAANVPAN